MGLLIEKAPVVISSDQRIYWEVAETQRDADHAYYLAKILEAVDGARLTPEDINDCYDKAYEKWERDGKADVYEFSFLWQYIAHEVANAQLQAIKKAIGERECKECGGIGKVWDSLSHHMDYPCTKCNGTGGEH